MISSGKISPKTGGFLFWFEDRHSTSINVTLLSQLHFSTV